MFWDVYEGCVAMVRQVCDIFVRCSSVQRKPSIEGPLSMIEGFADNSMWHFRSAFNQVFNQRTWIYEFVTVRLKSLDRSATLSFTQYLLKAWTFMLAVGSFLLRDCVLLTIQVNIFTYSTYILVTFI
jgi:hypothetical protein